MDEKIYPTYKLAKLAAVLEEQGCCDDGFLKGTNLTRADIQTNKIRISQRQLISAYHNAISLTKDPSIGLLAGHRLGVTDYGLYGYALISSATLREALLFSMKYHLMATPTVRMSLLVNEEEGISVFRMEDLIKIDSLYQFNLELQFGLVFSLFKEMAGPDFRFIEVCAKFPKVEHADTYAELFECNISFNQPYNDLRFDSDWLDKPLLRANSITAQITKELCDKDLIEMQLKEGLAGDVYRVITSNIRGFGQEEDVARYLNISSRTLRRKLSAEDTSFQKILNDARTKMAIEYLENSNFSIEEIAERLGFSDATNFRHAFKKWTGRTTGSYQI